jgi:lipopolysaccharide assembly outer membrane protein LptD (OstA)
MTMVLMCCTHSVSAQEVHAEQPLGLTQFQDTTATIQPMREFAEQDVPSPADSTMATADSLSLLHKSSLDAPAFTTAKDSIVEDFSNGKRMIYYYGDVSVTYGDMKLTANYMEYDLNSGTLFAKGTKDTNGTLQGTPVMEQGGKSYTMEEVRYNFNTQKARITNMLTQEQDGILHGKNIKMMPDKSINITKGRYTVCDCDEPHYYLHLTAAKVMTKPDQKTVFGPAYPVIADVPLPIGLPFGFIPKRPDRATGILFPTFGEEQSRGFYMRDAGVYFVIGEYFDIALTGDLYTLGSWAVDLNSRYKVNYKFNGNFSLTYSNDQSGEKGSPDFFQTRNFAVRWTHSQDAKARPGTSFSASVNFSSPSNSKYNS